MSEATVTPADRADLHRKMDAEIAKLSAETARLNAKLRSYSWLPLATTIMGSTGLIGAIAAILIALHK